MKRTGIVVDSRYLEHKAPLGHPERPERLAALIEMAGSLQREKIIPIAPRSADKEEILLNHEPSHYDLVAGTAGKHAFALDMDTYTSARSFETALLSTGGFLAIIEAIMEGEIDNGFALVRPPGHHAEKDRAMGFCLFNNVAVGAHLLLEKYQIERMLIVDWDVHHGNGTQRSFYEDPRVLYVSIHQYPFYPGTGGAGEVGSGEGEGITVNIPLPAGCGDAEYLAAFEKIISPICKQFDPHFILVSAGFDAHARDPLANMSVTENGFTAMTRILLGITNDHAGGRFAAVLEGGYDITALRTCIERMIVEMGQEGSVKVESALESEEDVLAPVFKIQKQYWDIS